MMVARVSHKVHGRFQRDVLLPDPSDSLEPSLPVPRGQFVENKGDVHSFPSRKTALSSGRDRFFAIQSIDDTGTTNCFCLVADFLRFFRFLFSLLLTRVRI